MINTVFSGNVVDALSLGRIIMSIKAPPAYAPHFDAIIKRIAALWPEAEGGIRSGSPLSIEVRDFEISPEERSAIGQGLFSIYENPETDHANRQLIVSLCDKGKVGISGWLRKKIAALPPIKEIIPGDDDPTPDDEG